MKMLRGAMPFHWLYGNQNKVAPNGMLLPQTILGTIKFSETPIFLFKEQKGIKI